MRVRTMLTLALVAVSATGALWSHDATAAKKYRSSSSSYRTASTVVPAGSPIAVRLDSKISTEDASRGDTWTGTVSQDVVSDGRVMIPAGSPVTGMVTSAVQGTHSTRPQIGLAVRRITVDGRSMSVNADTEPIVAGSDRAKKLGAVAAGAAAGALLGHTVAKDKHGTLIGGLLGGAASYGLTRHAFRTMQLKPGTVVTFTTRSGMVAYR